ncbi:serine hydrolase domain-containing protein [Haloplasma contractile]|uniref:Beta-lactamase protein n=1 Tax=Haloplasma contractile SSD-17B TaxID=1033810 RepID=F7PRE5_9MOLU|nr:serine hydrolase [Haloplasma contractile]ERJ11729.1 beta-lactamase protein [Haloplasma contractile SSD-17B]
MLTQGVKKLESLLEKAIDDGVFPGATYAIVTENEQHYGHMGNKSLEPKLEKNTQDVIYDIASLTKVVSTTTAIMKLIENGMIRLTDFVSHYLEAFKHKEVRIYHLLTHTSGLPADLSKAYELKNTDEVKQRIYDAELINPLGKRIVYSDIGFILLGFLVEKVTGKSLDSYIKEELFIPVEMHDTMYNPTNIVRCAPTEKREDKVYNGYLRGKVHDEKAYALGGVAGHAGLFSTHKDLGKFMQMILNSGHYKGKQILSKATIDLFYKRHVSETTFIPSNEQYRSLGWDLKSLGSSSGDLTSDETILHTGFTGTNMFIDRINKLGFVLLTNRVHPTRTNHGIIKVRPRLANILLSHRGE